MTFTFSAGNAHVKAGKFVKHFKFNDESETLECVPTPAKEQPFVKADQMSKDSFFYTWFNSEGEDDGILAAQEALGSELYLDPIAVRHTITHAHDTQCCAARTNILPAALLPCSVIRPSSHVLPLVSLFCGGRACTFVVCV